MGARIRAAAAAELIEGGVAQFSVSKVARRAGVAKGTVSLRYPEPLDLMVDALSEVIVWQPVPALGDLAAELRLLAGRLVESVFQQPNFGLMLSIIGAAAEQPRIWHHYVDRIVTPGVATVHEIFDRARQNEQLPDGLDLNALVAAFVGGLQIMTQADPAMNPPDADAREVLVQVILAACHRPAASLAPATRRQTTPTARDKPSSVRRRPGRSSPT